MIESEIRILLQSIAIQTRKRYANQLRELGLHIGQELALSHLWEQDGITQSQLRLKMGSEASTVSNMLRKLEQDDIIYRKVDDADHRISNVFLTSKGRQLEGPIMEIWKAHEQVLLAGIVPEELLLLRRILQQMDDNLL
ncbi:MarR family transcriptional regulator [Sporosarcina sp. Sa2YVA2]|uniref:MarR family transcriptional regulator n=1 Tax=Sporosarcina quadrami TaxID=2762234 RepID=A0ABR8UA79_9BACL|nr:MarR family transcriptional regulator [Sporosarcina quadrami]MBD7984950.1 MarR family transcriptional regulator [Sporosarcina quadrami]